jgi:hypothetical protein
MTSLMPIDRCLSDHRLLGAAIDMSTRQTWLTVWKAAYALPLTDAERDIFNNIAGGRKPPTQRVREIWIDAGRRSGKSEMATICAIHASLFVKHKLTRGTIGMVLVVAGTRDQAGVVFNMIKEFLDSSPTLKREVVNANREEITLRNGIVISVFSNSFRTIRGRTLVVAIFDEVSFWRDESSATPDVEVYRAVMPSLATTKGMLTANSDCFIKNTAITMAKTATRLSSKAQRKLSTRHWTKPRLPHSGPLIQPAQSVSGMQNLGTISPPIWPMRCWTLQSSMAVRWNCRRNRPDTTAPLLMPLAAVLAAMLTALLSPTKKTVCLLSMWCVLSPARSIRIKSPKALPNFASNIASAP